MFARRGMDIAAVLLVALALQCMLCTAHRSLLAEDSVEQATIKVLSDVDNDDIVHRKIHQAADDDEDEEELIVPEEEPTDLLAARAERTAPLPRLIHPRAISRTPSGMSFGLPFRQGDFDEEILVGGGLGWRAKVHYPNINAVVGDVLVFVYKWPFMNSVWLLPRKKCTFIKAKELAGVNEEMPFRYILDKPGTFHFASSVPGHCAGGMLFSVRVKE